MTYKVVQHLVIGDDLDAADAQPTRGVQALHQRRRLQQHLAVAAAHKPHHGLAHRQQNIPLRPAYGRRQHRDDDAARPRRPHNLVACHALAEDEEERRG